MTLFVIDRMHVMDIIIGDEVKFHCLYKHIHKI